MALQFVLKGSQAFSLSKDDINKYPGSLLHALITSVDSSDGLVVKLDDLPDSMFVSWPAAVAITTDLYRKGNLEASTLSGLLKQHATADLFNKLQALIDYLLLPGPVPKYLPDRSKVPLLYVSVYDLYYQAAANDAVQAILSSTAFSEGKICTHIHRCLSQRAAFFYLSAIPDDICVVKVQAHAVSASDFSDWKPATSETAYAQLAACTVSSMTAVKVLPKGPEMTLLKTSTSIPADHKLLVPMIKAGLQEGLAAAGSEVNGTEMHVTLIKAVPLERFIRYAEVPLWVVHW